MSSQMKELFNNRVQIAKDWKENGGKVLGYLNALTPQEMMYAADILPVQLLTSGIRITRSNMHLPEFLCTHLKDCLEQSLAGELDYLDGLLASHACEGLRGFFGVWKLNANLPNSYLLQVPATAEDDSREYFLHELKLLKNFLEEVSGRKITDERLQHAIEVHNENRSLMQQLSDLRKEPGSPVSGRDVLEALMAGLVIPKDMHNEQLKKLVADYREKAQPPGPKNRINVCIASNALEEIDVILEVIEEAGGHVISDNFCSGTRYCREPVQEGSDPMVSLADHYVGKIPFPGKYPTALIADQLTDMVKDTQADGMIWVAKKFCDPYLFTYPILLDSVKKKDIKLLSIEAEEAGSIPRLKMKIEAFMESLQDDLMY